MAGKIEISATGASAHEAREEFCQLVEQAGFVPARWRADYHELAMALTNAGVDWPKIVREARERRAKSHGDG